MRSFHAHAQLFCDAASGDLTLAASSPCAQANSPDGCGLIGALPVACLPPVYIVHTPLEHTEDTQNPIPITAQITATQGSLVADSLRVNYSIDLGPVESVVMTPTVNPDEYSGSIPAQPAGTRVHYFISAADDAGHRSTHPPDDPPPGQPTHFLFVGVYERVADADMETDPGWTVGPNSATGGIWERADPVGVIAYRQGEAHVLQPFDDHTPDPGVMCWMTENGPGIGTTDVDNGETRLVTGTYDLAGEPFARLTVWLFYSNDLGPGYPGEDLFDIDMSTNGGGTWINLVSRLANTNDVFERLSFDLHDRVLLTSSMRFRFIARDLGGSSLVEAAVDDFMIEVLPPIPAGIEPGASPARRFVVAQNRPNPFNPSTAIRLTLPVSMPLTLRIYDTAGRSVCTLVDGTLEAGDHNAVWNGRDAAGREAASGIYYYRIESPAYGATRKMVLMR